MRITTILILIASLHVCASGLSQTVSLNVKNQPLKNVFKEISKQTGVSILCDESLFELSKPVTLNLEKASLDEALHACFIDQPLKFEIVNNAIVVKPSPTPDLSRGVISPSPSHPSPSTIDIHGHVADSLGNPLAGASVTIKGKPGGTVTDVNGNFILNGVDPKATVIISYTGYENRIIKLNGKNEIAIQLKQKPTSLQDVVVNKGYYTTTQALNTGDVAVVSGETIAKQPVTDPMQALEGRVAGLSITQSSGVPGASSQILIRGQNFLSNGIPGQNAPYFIVDGIPFSSEFLVGIPGYPSVVDPNQSGLIGLSPFNLLNPADISSIEVLKDADATAIYGSRGANGVILITTKKGKAGKTNVNFNLSTGFSKQSTTVKLLNTHQYLEMRNEAFKNEGITPGPYDFDVNNFWDTTRYTDWSKVLLGNSAAYTAANASISGGTANTQFLLGVGYNYTGTYFVGDYGNKNISLNFSLSHASIDQKFHMNFTGYYSNQNNNNPGYQSGNITAYAPDAPAIYDANGNLNWQPYQGTNSWYNPFALKYVSSKTVSGNLMGTISLSYLIVTGLQIKTDFGYNKVESNQTTIIPSTSAAPPYNTDPYSRYLGLSNTTGGSWNNETQLSYSRKIARGHLDILLGTTIQQQTSSSNGESAAGFSSDALISNPAAASTFGLAGSSSSEYKYASVYGRIGYDWEQKYIINLTGRRDGSSRFGPSKQYGNFGAIGIGWIFSKENIFQNHVQWLSFGKLRGSYGIAGSDGIGNYQFLSTYYISGQTYQGTTSLYPAGVTDPYFSWQSAKKLEFGLDFGILNRINATISWYQNRCGNQLVSYTLPQITGFSGVTTNFPALVQNSGWEFNLNTVNIRNNDFNWSTSFNLSLQQNLLLDFPNLETSAYRNLYRIGHSINSQHVFHYLGINPQTGTYSFSSVSGGEFLDQTDKVWSQPVTQQYFGGLDNTFSYKGFSVDIFFQFVKQNGNGYQKTFPPPGNSQQNQPVEVLNRWQKPGDLATSERYTTDNTLTGELYQVYYQQSDAVIVDASFIRLKNVAISYQLPLDWRQKMNMQNASVYINFQNLLTITGYHVLDPETQSLLAPVKTIALGINLTF